MNELSFLKINESQVPIDAYKSIMENYIGFLKYFYGNKIDLAMKKGSQILQAVKKDNQDIDNNEINDFSIKLNQDIIDRKTHKKYYKPISSLYEISRIQNKSSLQEVTLSFNKKDISIGKAMYDKLAPYYEGDIRELTSIIGSINLIADKEDKKLKIRVIDKEDKKEINGIIKTNNKEHDKELFEKIRKDYYGEEVLISGILHRNQITFAKKTIYIIEVKQLKNSQKPLADFKGILG